MKRKIYHTLLCGLALLMFGACHETEIETDYPEPAVTDAITLTVAADNMPISRATHDTSPTAAESVIEHIDVLIFSEQASGSFEDAELYYYEPVPSPADGSGTVTLKKKRSEFLGGKYYVYLLANYTGTTLDGDGNVIIKNPDDVFVSKEGDPFTISDLRALTQYDVDIDFTGTGLASVNNLFLMDGIAYEKNGGAESADHITPIALTLNDGTSNGNTELMVKLRRAAAKIMVYITASDNVRFDNDEKSAAGDQLGSVGFYFQHLTTQTHLVPPTELWDNDSTKETSTDGMRRESGWGFSANDKYLVLTNETLQNATEKGGSLPNNYVSKISVQGYAYAHNWKNKEAGHDTRLVISIPLWHKDITTTENAGGTATETTTKWSFHGNNYYQIPVSASLSLKRNTLYTVNVKIDAVGSTNVSTAVELEDVSFNTMPWTDVNIGIGEESQDSPKYLSVNETEIPIYRMGSSGASADVTTAPVDVDSTLVFASSSAVSVEIANWYYENDAGARQYRYGGNTNNGNTPTDEEGNTISRAANESQFQYALDTNGNYIINPDDYSDATKKTHTVELFNPKDPNKTGSQKLTLSNLNGKIGIRSTTPSNFAIRYIILKVSNAEGVEPRYVVFEQYPTIYVTHEMGWYSYRKDFGGTSWEYLHNLVSLDGASSTHITADVSDIFYSSDFRCSCSWRSDNTWSYSTSRSDGFFRNKVYYDGMIYTTNWTRNTSGGGWFGGGSYTGTYTRGRTEYSLQNPRMYKIQVSATTGNYTLGVPRRDSDGTTSATADNQLLVSPSFMVASQLGGASAGSLDTDKDIRLKQAADHCNQYVETYKDPKTGKTIHLDDWRLPTKAEILFIIETQYAPNSPLAEVLSGEEYLSATGDYVTNDNYSVSGTGIRCVRDAYKTPEGSATPIVRTKKSLLDSNNDGLRPTD